MAVEVVTDNNYQKYKDFIRFSLFRGKYYRFGFPSFIALVILALAIFVLTVLTIEMDTFLTVLFIFLFTVILLFAYLYFVLPVTGYKKARSWAKGIRLIYRFGEDDFTLKTDNTENSDFVDDAKLKYNIIFRIYETDKAFYLYLSKAQAFIISKSDIIAGSVDDLRELLVKNTPPKTYIKCS
jgi:hypothetical protein